MLMKRFVINYINERKSRFRAYNYINERNSQFRVYNAFVRLVISTNPFIPRTNFADKSVSCLVNLYSLHTN